MVSAKLLTAEQFARIPDDGTSYELVRGKLVMMSRPDRLHARIMAWISYLLTAHVEQHGLGVVLAGDPGCVLERAPDTVRGPDVAFLSKARGGLDPQPAEWVEGSPDLVVEIVSKHDRKRAVHAKAQEYIAAGARLVWVVDPRAHTVHVHRPGGRVDQLARGDALDGEDVLPGFRVTLERLIRVAPPASRS